MPLEIIKRELTACCRGIGVPCIVHRIHRRLQNSAENLQLSSIYKAMPQQRKM